MPIAPDSAWQQFDAFCRGFHHVCGGPAVTLVDPQELELLVCGSPDFNFDALERATQYTEGFTRQSPVIRWLWSALHDMDQPRRMAFLHFVTGSSRVPISGLGKVVIVVQRNGSDCDRLPTAMTCFSRLLLPEYATEEKLQRYLRLALDNDHGFGNL